MASGVGVSTVAVSSVAISPTPTRRCSFLRIIRFGYHRVQQDFQSFLQVGIVWILADHFLQVGHPPLIIGWQGQFPLLIPGKQSIRCNFQVAQVATISAGNAGVDHHDFRIVTRPDHAPGGRMTNHDMTDSLVLEDGINGCGQGVGFHSG